MEGKASSFKKEIIFINYFSKSNEPTNTKEEVGIAKKEFLQYFPSLFFTDNKLRNPMRDLKYDL